MGATRGAQQKGRCTHNSSNLVFCDLHSCSSSIASSQRLPFCCAEVVVRLDENVELDRDRQTP